MTSIMRRTVRGAAAGMGALAIVAGTAACGGLLGGGDEGDGDTGTEQTQEGGGDSSDSEGEDTKTEEDSEDTGTEEDSEGTGSEEDSEDSEMVEETEGSEDEDSEDGSDDAGDSADAGDDAAAAGELSEDDLTAVGDTYYAFLEAVAGSDGEAACSMVTNPDTDKPLEGGEVKLCAKSFEGGAEESGVDPSMLDAIDRSMVEAVDNGDGTAGVTLMGQDAGVTFVDVDGTWYIDGSQFI